jgi:hypothetical protein
MIMKNSSNTNMKEVFKHLANIKMAEPSGTLYAQTLIKLQRKNTIPLFWVKAAACLLIAFITTEYYIASTKNKSADNDILLVIYKTNNILYNE